MSLSKWLIKKKTPNGNTSNLESLLPDPNLEKTPESAKTIQAANSSVLSVIRSSGKRKRGEYSQYDSSQRAKIARYACENGNSSAVKHFSKELGKPISESTIRSMKKHYLRQLEHSPNSTVSELPKGKPGRPLLLGKYDEDVVDYVHKLRNSGAIVSKQIVIACATGIVQQKAKHLLRENGGHISLERSWAESFLRRIGFVRRKGTKAARKLPLDFEEQKLDFLASIRTIATERQIPHEMIINFDQTNISIIPCGNWTMHQEGAKQVEITGLEDKRQITALLSCTMSGDLLPPQLLYQGKTENCHPKINFPKDWDIWHSENHWSNEETMLRFLDKIIIPYVMRTRERLDLPLRHPALAIFDVFAAHRVDSFLTKLEGAGIKVKFIPGGCTGELQPLDLSGNAQFKEVVKSQFVSWYAKQISSQLKAGKSVKECDVDLKLSNIKPVNARWIINAWEKVRNESNVIQTGWRSLGMLK